MLYEVITLAGIKAGGYGHNQVIHASLCPLLLSRLSGPVHRQILNRQGSGGRAGKRLPAYASSLRAAPRE